MSKDITVEIFLALRNKFFTKTRKPIAFELRPKKNTQDDPLDEYIAENVLSKLNGVDFNRSGALTSPDVVVYKKDASQLHPIQLEDNSNMIVGMEIKRVGRNKQGVIARSSSVDFNSTPPCGTILVYDKNNEPLNIKGFYLFVCLEKDPKWSHKMIISALSLVDGNLLNDDYDFYLSVIGERTKKIGLGSYGDGMNRSRPMLGFANPLGINGFNRNVTLVHSRDDLNIENDSLYRVNTILRTSSSGTVREFYGYRFKDDVPEGWECRILVDPFEIPKGRTTRTNQRGRFKVAF